MSSYTLVQPYRVNVSWLSAIVLKMKKVSGEKTKAEHENIGPLSQLRMLAAKS